MRLVSIVAVVVIMAAVVYFAIRRPHRNPLPPATPDQIRLAGEVRRDVEALAAIGPRSIFIPGSLPSAAAHIERAFRDSGYDVQKQRFSADGVPVENVWVEIGGRSRPSEIVVIGAHYDSVDISPGADDNASGVAALLAIARRIHSAETKRTIRLIAFTNEEPPMFTSAQMGSYVHARHAREHGENIVGMLSLESIGYYDPRPRSQRYPPPLSLMYPSTGDFIGFAGNLRSRALIAKCVESFRRHAQFPAESAALPELIQEIGWSDQWSFWQFGYPALMVTDTAPFRNPHYHAATDRPETLDYDRLARVTEGLVGVTLDLASE